MEASVNFFRHAMHLEVLLSKGEGINNAIASIEDLIEWTQSHALSSPPLIGLRSKVAREVLLTCCNMVTLGICDVNFIGHLIELCTDLLEKGISLKPYWDVKSV